MRASGRDGTVRRSNHPDKEYIVLSLSSGRGRLAGGIVTLVAALAVTTPAMASVPDGPEVTASSLNFSYSWGAAGADFDSTAFHFTRKAG